MITSIDVRAIGLAVIVLGGGRTRPQDPVDPAVGFTRLRGIAESVSGGEPLAFVHARDRATAEAATAMLVKAYRFDETVTTDASNPVLERFGESA
jgi:thymidine phosphorylase